VSLTDFHLHRNQDQGKIEKEDFVDITSFFLDHFTKDCPATLQGLGQIVQFFTQEGAFHTFKSYLERPSEKSGIEKGLEALTPTIIEYTLYFKVCELFRKSGVVFDGDAKFWEIFIREMLKEKVKVEFADLPKGGDAEKSAYRQELIKKMLKMEIEELKRFLSVRSPIQSKPKTKVHGSLDEITHTDYPKVPEVDKPKAPQISISINESYL